MLLPPLYASDLSRKDRSLFNRATKIAKDSKCRIKHGALLVNHGKVVAQFPNKWRNHPSNVSDPKKDSSRHAEAELLRNVKDAQGMTVFVARVNNLGSIMISKPCSACEELLREAGIKKVIYSLGETEVGVDEY